MVGYNGQTAVDTKHHLIVGSPWGVEYRYGSGSVVFNGEISAECNGLCQSASSIYQKTAL